MTLCDYFRGPSEDDRRRAVGEDGEEGSYVSNIRNIVGDAAGNILGKGIGKLSTKFGGGTSWF